MIRGIIAGKVFTKTKQGDSIKIDINATESVLFQRTREIPIIPHNNTDSKTNIFVKLRRKA